MIKRWGREVPADPDEGVRTRAAAAYLLSQLAPCPPSLVAELRVRLGGERDPSARAAFRLALGAAAPRADAPQRSEAIAALEAVFAGDASVTERRIASLALALVEPSRLTTRQVRDLVAMIGSVRRALPDLDPHTLSSWSSYLDPHALVGVLGSLTSEQLNAASDALVGWLRAGCDPDPMMARHECGPHARLFRLLLASWQPAQSLSSLQREAITALVETDSYWDATGAPHAIALLDRFETRPPYDGVAPFREQIRQLLDGTPT